nr:DUF1799 domain-containing protein [Mesorhizobium sp.]
MVSERCLRQLPPLARFGRRPPGKLIEVAEAWARAHVGRADDTRPQRPDAEIRRQAEALGVPDECLPPEEDDEDEDGPMVEVWRGNWQSVMLFLSLETQWRTVATMVGLIWLGVDYIAADVIMRHRPLEERRSIPAAELLVDLAAMERAALPLLNEARDDA